MATKPDLVLGYPKLAAHMGDHPYTAIFRRFRTMNAKILLYYQAELTQLERELEECEIRDANDPSGNKKNYANDWRLCVSNSDGSGDDEQLHIANKIKKKLREYNELLIQGAELSNLYEPNRYDLKELRRWLRLPGFGFSSLHGPDRETWGRLHHEPQMCDQDPAFDDLVALHPRQEDDFLSRFLSDTCVPIYHQRFRRGRDNITEYSEAQLRRYSSVLSTVLSSLFPLISIIALVNVDNTNSRLGIVCSFTALFSLSLALVTNARRVDIFAATAAFAAIQVVFVGTTVNSGGDG